MKTNLSNEIQTVVKQVVTDLLRGYGLNDIEQHRRLQWLCLKTGKNLQETLEFLSAVTKGLQA